jgi:hypothetical protein
MFGAPFYWPGTASTRIFGRIYRGACHGKRACPMLVSSQGSASTYNAIVDSGQRISNGEHAEFECARILDGARVTITGRRDKRAAV